jgi:hypothetical protein
MPLVVAIAGVPSRALEIWVDDGLLRGDAAGGVVDEQRV